MKTIRTEMKTLIILLALTGCAHMDHGAQQPISINTIPEGATIKVDPNGENGVTPIKLILKRKVSHIVHIYKEGYKPESIVIESKSSGEVWKNIVWIHPIGWIIGGTIDLSTGASKELNPNTINITLTK